MYLGDRLNAAVTSKICVGWKRFRELSGVLCGKNGKLG